MTATSPLSTSPSIGSAATLRLKTSPSGSAHITRATRNDALRLATQLRECDRQECYAMFGEGPELMLPLSLTLSTFSGSIRSPSGEIVGMFGVGPSSFHGVGRPWMVASPEIERRDIAITFLRRSPEIVAEMHKQYRILSNYVYAQNALHIAWLRWLGFSFFKKVPINGHDFIEFVRLDVS